MSYRYTRNKHSKLQQETKPHNDFFAPLERTSTINWSSLVYDKRTRNQKLHYYRKNHKRLLRTGYKQLMGTEEQTLYIKGPSQGVWNKVEKL